MSRIRAGGKSKCDWAVTISTVVVAVGAAGRAGATDGYFSAGYGLKSIGMGGASITRTDDAFGGANNPAAMVFAGNRFDLGVSLFSPDRSASRTGGVITPLNGSVTSTDTHFTIPEMGVNYLVVPELSLGVTLYGNGGMNTSYPQGTFQCPTPVGFAPTNMLCGQGRLGVNLTQLMVAPTIAYKFLGRHAIGISPLLAYQRFSIQGVQLFSQLSEEPSAVSNNGTATSTGTGVRIGYLGQLSDMVSIGAMYTTKTSMSRFTDYAGLFAGQGKFDIPSHYGAGIGWHPSADWTIALDYERILYSQVPAVGDPSTNQTPLGSSNGPGFGWKDVNVVKLGVQAAVMPGLTLRAGYNHSDNPIQARDVTFNILAPGVVQDHFTLGATYAVKGAGEVTLAYMYAPSKSVTGSSLLNPLFQAQGGPPNAAGSETIKLGETLFGVAWGTRF